MGFESPKSDTCAVCDRHEIYEEHKTRAKLAFEMQRKDKDTVLRNLRQYYIAFYLQKTLPLPKLSTGIAFYLRQVWLYKLGIHLISNKTDKGFFHLWTEDEGGRGCDEICSSLMVFLDTAGINGGHLIVWSDSCAGQNKNFFVLCLSNC